MKRKLNLSEKTILQMTKMNKIIGGGYDYTCKVDNCHGYCTSNCPR
jgi:hypothetical protein